MLIKVAPLESLTNQWLSSAEALIESQRGNSKLTKTSLLLL